MRRVLAVVMLAALVGGGPAEAQSPSPSASPAASLGGFGDGTWLVGSDVQPGTYRAPGGEGCYWERLSGFGGTTDEIVANDNPVGPVIVTIQATDLGFATAACGAWVPMGGVSVAAPTASPDAGSGLALHGRDLVFDELSKRASLGVSLRKFVRIWNRETDDKDFRISRLPKVSKNGNGVPTFTADLPYPGDLYFGFVGSTIGDQVASVMLNWTRSVREGTLERGGHELAAMLAVLAFASAVGVDDTKDFDFEGLGWPVGEDGTPASFAGREGQTTVDGVTFTMSVVPTDDAQYESVLVVARKADA